MIAAPGTSRGTILIDAFYRHLPDADSPLKHNMEIKLFSGAAEVVARTRVIGQKQIEPGQEGWLQLALQEPISVVRDDRFILRRPSPAATLGGGRILDPHPGRQRRRFKVEEIERLKTLTEGTDSDRLLQTLNRIDPVAQNILIKESGLDRPAAETSLQELEENNDIKHLGNQLITFAGWQRLLDKMIDILDQYHKEYPLRLGIPREELRSRLKLSPAVFNPLVQESNDQALLVEEGPYLRLAEHTIQFSPRRQEEIERLLTLFAKSGVSSPSVKDCKTAVGDDVYRALIDLGNLVQLNNEVVYEKNQFAGLIVKITDFLQENNQIDAAQTRDLLNTSRKYAIAILEYLDDNKVTRRTGDYRVLYGK